MDNESMARLKFDTRLRGRRDWVEPEELAQELASLPDCSDKIMEPEEAEGSAPSEAADGGGGTPTG